MATDARAIKIRKAIHVELGTVKMWAKRAFSRERVTEMAVAAVTGSVLVSVTGFLCQVAQNY
jgi:hypothetical protein